MLKKGFTLIEVTVVILILSILSSAAFISYNYYTEKNRYNSAISQGEVILEAVILSFETQNNTIDESAIRDTVSKIANHNINIKTVIDKAISLEYNYEQNIYDLNIDLASYKMNIVDIRKGKKIYEN